MPDNDAAKTHEKILTYWSIIETLNPQSIPKMAQSSHDEKIYSVQSVQNEFPWHATHPHQGIKISDKQKWVYTIYGGSASLQHSINYIHDLFPKNDSKIFNSTTDSYCLFSLNIDTYGRIIDDSINLSSFAWAIGQLERHKTDAYKILNQFLEADDAIKGEINTLYKDVFTEANFVRNDARQSTLDKHLVQPVLAHQLFGLLNLINEQMNRSDVKMTCVFTIKATLLSDDMNFSESSGVTNSFFLKDLHDLRKAAAEHNLSKGALQFLTHDIPHKTRIDIRKTNAAFIDAFSPHHYPTGCWPHYGNTPLVFSQQFAVNSFFKQHTNDDGIFSVNGPPGTGKTTLLRDIIAHIIVLRAHALTTFKSPSDAFSAAPNTVNGKESPIHYIHDCLHGFEIVVASSNNAAVENITLEIPGIEAVDPSILENIDYFKPWAERLIHEKSWAMIATRLGNKSNRDQFIKNFWLGLDSNEDYINLSKAIHDKRDDGKGFEGYLRVESLLPTDWSNEWLSAIDDFNQACAIENELRTERQRIYDAYRLDVKDARQIGDKLCRELGYNLIYVPTFLCSDDKMTLAHMTTQECSSPWMDPAWHDARVNVFIKALALHKAFIMVNAQTIRINLKHFMLMLTGDTSMSADDYKHLWGTLFLLIPTISTTFASLPRLFSTLKKASIGWTLIDEAGQALPQAAIGCLWRSKRALIVGDPLQLEPVIALNETIQTQLAHFADIPPQWIPRYHSVQNIADRMNRLGTHINGTWIGVPLRVHRRCDDIIFRIANKMAYDHMMVFGTPNRTPLDLPETQWIHVESAHTVNNWVPEEGIVLENLLEQLSGLHVNMSDVFLISPFIDVIYNTRNLKKRFGIKSGTIHSVQGKENEIVILVLGGRPQNQGTRWWATRTPNLLNVAITRAKRRLYVIGNKRLWSQHPHAKVLAWGLS